MSYLNKLYTAALLAVSFAVVSPAHALLLNTGDEVIYNFDFTGATPPPPYVDVVSTFFFSGFDAADGITFKFFDGLNATGAHLAILDLSAPGPLGPQLHLETPVPGVLDGVFSIEVTADHGPFEITGVTGTGNRVGGEAQINATIGSRAPEPATLALLGIGLVGLGFSRRQRKQ